VTGKGGILLFLPALVSEKAEENVVYTAAVTAAEKDQSVSTGPDSDVESPQLILDALINAYPGKLCSLEVFP